MMSLWGGISTRVVAVVNALTSLSVALAAERRRRVSARSIAVGASERHRAPR